MTDPRHLPDMPEMMIAGPGELRDEDLEVAGHQVIAHYGEVWTGIHRATTEAVGKLLGAEEPAYLIPGSGSLALEAAISNLFEPGQKALVANTGFFGQRIVDIATAVGLDVTEFDIEVGAPIDPDYIESAAEGFDAVITVHVETANGVRHPIRQIAAAAHRAGAAYVVDAIASAGGELIDIAGWDIDALATATQKGLEGPPGMGIVSVGPRGRERLGSRTTPVPSWYLNLDTWERFRSEWGSWHPHPVTMPTTLVLALASSVKRIADAGIEQWVADRAELAKRLRDGLSELGLKPVPQPGCESNLVIAAWADDPASIQSHLLDRGIMISPGLGVTKDKAIRIGLMGRTATDEMVGRVLKEIAEALAQ